MLPGPPLPPCVPELDRESDEFIVVCDESFGLDTTELALLRFDDDLVVVVVVEDEAALVQLASESEGCDWEDEDANWLLLLVEALV